MFFIMPVRITLGELKTSNTLLKPWQLAALDDFKTGDYLIHGRDPPNSGSNEELILDDKFKGSIVVSGAVGVGKTTLLAKVLETEGYLPCREFNYMLDLQYSELFWRERTKDVVVSFSDFSNYISRHLRDIPPNSSFFHAQVMYRSQMDELLKIVKELPKLFPPLNTWRLVFDRFPLENIVFATEECNSNLLLSEFWPTKNALNNLKKICPRDIIFVALYCCDEEALIKNHGSKYNDSLRAEHIKKRNRCEFELKMANASSEWFYDAALAVYKHSLGPNTCVSYFDPYYLEDATIANFGSIINK